MRKQKPRLNFISSWDDGHELDAILAKTLHTYKLPGIFYLPSHSPMYYKISELLDLGFEIGGHTMTHPMDMKLLTEDEIDWEIGSNKKLLELQGAVVTKFCYPRGRYDDRVIECLKKYKFRSARTTEVLNIWKNDDPFREKTSIHIYPRAEYKNREWMDIAREYAAQASVNNGLFHLWGHSWEIDKLKQWDNLNEFLKWINQEFDIWKY